LPYKLPGTYWGFVRTEISATGEGGIFHEEKVIKFEFKSSYRVLEGVMQMILSGACIPLISWHICSY
jgi:hypothetical protein